MPTATANEHEISGNELLFTSSNGHEGDGDENNHTDYTGDYNSRMEEVLGLDGEEDEEEDFLYQGVDSKEASATYNEQLHGFLEGLSDEVDITTDIEEERQVEQQLDDTETFIYEDGPKVEVSSDHSPSNSSQLFSTFHPEETSTIVEFPSKTNAPFLHPTISRLRSYVPSSQNKRLSSASSFPNVSASPSHFSAISRSSSVLNSIGQPEAPDNNQQPPREVFRWAILREISQRLYMQKASSILGSFHGSPTVLSANGLLCIGTERGRVLVFDFKQQLKCVCGDEAASELAGPVSAVSLSRDHTFLAVGHAFGHINLYDISRPQLPARSVPPTSLAAVASGRKEGHIEGVRIVSLGFVGARHTAIISADENGLAFYHSLGKVFFVEATDTLRILGKYPDVADDVTLPQKKFSPAHANGEDSALKNPVLPRPWKPRKGSTILAMASFPLGTVTHPTETYNLIALLTPAKLVVVGLKPSARTWFRKHRDNNSDLTSETSKWRGCLAWFPSIDPTSDPFDGTSGSSAKRANSKEPMKSQLPGTDPILAYSWDRTIRLLRISETKVKQTVLSTRNPGKTMVVEVGKIEVDEMGHWSTNSDYLAIQWLNMHQVLALTATHLEVWDARTAKQVECVPFDVGTLSSPSLPENLLDQARVSHCLKTYKGKVFVLGLHELKVGTLLSWADKILAFVEVGDFLSAINTTCAYYLGTAPGNKMGLPDDPTALQALVGKRMRDLMVASARYAFAEERLTDATHVTSDGRGVDRTDLFKGLVDVCVNACAALNDFEFVFEDLFEYYQNSGITSIFLRQLEHYVLDGTVTSIPPRITQRLIGIYEDRGDLVKAERLIWHIDPDCLDINQAITLCQRNNLYDALIYVYTRSLCDFVTPLVDLLGLIRQIQRYRREERLRQRLSSDQSSSLSNQFLESKIPDAYKVYTYLADILSGLTYPSQRPMPTEEAFQAKKDVYAFLFFGHSYVWPVGEGGKLILTSDEDGGSEPTYPYVRLLLRFDAEAFLHAMDIAFEDEYFNDETQGVSRLVVIYILLDILSSPGLSPSDITMLNIFIARNVPKYPQSIHIAPSTLHNILVGLAADSDQNTREDRQLAAEYLLSAYMPHDGDRIVQLFENAGFYRILRTWHRQEHKWSALVSTYLHDPDVDPAEIFESLDEVLTTASRENKGVLPAQVLTTILDATPQLLNTGVTETAFLVDKNASGSHSHVLHAMGPDAAHRQFAYLRCLIEPAALSDETYWSDPAIRRLHPSQNLDQASRELYVRLLCQYDASGVIRCLSSLDDDYFVWDSVIAICEENGVDDAVIWSLNKHGNVSGAFDKLKIVGSNLSSQVGEHLASDKRGPEMALEVQHLLNRLKALGEIGLRICSERSEIGSSAGSKLEDIWFSLLSSQIDAVQTVSAFCASNTKDDHAIASQEQHTLGSLRSLVQKTFTSLMALGSSPALSFPRLFKRLVDSASNSPSSSQSSYSEFRLILTGILDSYRGEGDLLFITNRLVERDLFATVDEYARRRLQGSRVRSTFCMSCKNSLHDRKGSKGEDQAREHGVLLEASGELLADGWVIQRITGLAYHRKCLPSGLNVDIA